MSQGLIEDNIVAVSKQMIDKEASVARLSNGKEGQQQGAVMEVDEEL